MKICFSDLIPNWCFAGGGSAVPAGGGSGLSGVGGDRSRPFTVITNIAPGGGVIGVGDHNHVRCRSRGSSRFAGSATAGSGKVGGHQEKKVT